MSPPQLTSAHKSPPQLTLTPIIPQSLQHSHKRSDILVHHLISSNISAETPQPGLLTALHQQHQLDLLCVSEELLMCDLDANDYAILLNSKLEILLDKHAPVKKRSVLVGQLSNEAIEAKKRCRRMERLYRRKRTGAAKQAYKSAKEAKLAILNSKASSIKEEFNSNANPRSMWRSLHRILHSRPQQHYSDAECQSLVTSFNTFFISKIT